MEDIKKLGEMALKLEMYRYNIIASLGWAIFGMLFGSTIILCTSLQIFGMSEWVWILLLPAGIVSGYIYKRFWLFVPETEAKKMWKIGTILLVIPFIVFYTILPALFDLTPFYFAIIWYPSLGIGHLLFGVYTKTRVMCYAGMAMLLTSLVFLTIPKDALAGILLGTAVMLLIYLTCFLCSFFKAQEKFYA